MKFFLSPIKNKETKNSSKKLKSNGYFAQVIYMQNECSERQMINALSDGDILEIQADSIPWVLGGENVDKRTDFSPFSLAEYFEKLFSDKNIKITIDLRCCNSATIATGPRGEICFARDLSQALRDLGFNQITVHGYTAYIHSKNIFKQSAVAEGVKHGAKVAHCTLDSARAIYKGGALISDSSKKLVSESYTEADIKNDTALSDYITDQLKHQAKVASNALGKLKLESEESELPDADSLLQEEGSRTLLLSPLEDAFAESKENILDAINTEAVELLEKKSVVTKYI